jgi:hypothetical protein
MSTRTSITLRLLAGLLAGAFFGWYLFGSLLWATLSAFAVVVFTAYLPLLLNEPDFLRPEPGATVGGQRAGKGVKAVGEELPPAARDRDTLPALRPPEGVVTARSPGREPDEERAGLLRALAEGPDFRRAPAATALALHCAATSDLEVLSALVEAVVEEEYENLVRVEALLALYRVLGQSMPTALEGELRQRFPQGVDWDFVHGCQRRVEKATS